MTFLPAYSASECCLPSLPAKVNAGAFCPSSPAMKHLRIKIVFVYHTDNLSINDREPANGIVNGNA
jgi:hypothetical protein